MPLHGRTDRNATQCRHDRPGGDEGPDSGMASAPIPAIPSQRPADDAARAGAATAPSGALVCFSCAKSRLVPLSGNSTEMSLLESPSDFQSIDNLLGLDAGGGDAEYVISLTYDWFSLLVWFYFLKSFFSFQNLT